MDRRVLLALALLLGASVGLGAFTFGYARGWSYLSNDPGACANCHVMREHLAAWSKGSHHATATCNDCHTPHDLVGKYLTKARDGFWHSFYFTTGRYPYPIRILPHDHEITEAACRRCHGEYTDVIEHGTASRPVGAAAEAPNTIVDPEAAAQMTAAAAQVGADAPPRRPEPLTCTRCHRYVGHWVR